MFNTFPSKYYSDQNTLLQLNALNNKIAFEMLRFRAIYRWIKLKYKLFLRGINDLLLCIFNQNAQFLIRIYSFPVKILKN